MTLVIQPSKVESFVTSAQAALDEIWGERLQYTPHPGPPPAASGALQVEIPLPLDAMAARQIGHLAGRTLLTDLAASTVATVNICRNSSGYCYPKNNGIIRVDWCPDKHYYGAVMTVTQNRSTCKEDKHPPTATLAHELVHALLQLRGQGDWDKNEMVVRGENEIRFELGYALRLEDEDGEVRRYARGGAICSEADLLSLLSLADALHERLIAAFCLEDGDTDWLCELVRRLRPRKAATSQISTILSQIEDHIELSKSRLLIAACSFSCRRPRVARRIAGTWRRLRRSD